MIVAAWLRVAVTDWVAVATLATPPLALAFWVRSKIQAK